MKIVPRAFKYRFYPNKQQEEQLAHSFGCARFIYNRFLKIRSDAYKEKKEKIGYKQTSELLTQLKKEKEFSWLKDISSVVLQQSLRNLDRAFTNFFDKRAKYPNFKSKHGKQSIRYVNTAFTYSEGVLTLAKQQKPLKIRFSRRFFGKVTSVTISKDCANRYFVSFCVEEPLHQLPKKDKIIGIDMGVKDLCVTSEGEKSGSFQFFRKYEKKLALLQRRLSRKLKGSKNRVKARLKVAKAHAKIRDCRDDVNHKLTTELISENQAIAVESLHVKGMIRNKKLSKSIADASFGDFLKKLSYKSLWYGRSLIEIDRWFPSSKKCSCCGYIFKDLKLHMRTWQCPSCGQIHDRDINAAKNVLAAGLAVIAFGESGRLGIDHSVLSGTQ